MDRITAHSSKAILALAALASFPGIVWAESPHFINSQTQATIVQNGDLVVKGDNNTPVIVSPKNPPIAWSLFEAVQIRMLAEGGNEIKIKKIYFRIKKSLFN